MEFERKKKEKIIIDRISSLKPEKIELLKKSICHIDKRIMGFLAYIPYAKNDDITMLITNNKSINEVYLRENKKIRISLNDAEKTEITLDIDDNRKIYSSPKYNITVIEIFKNKDKLKDFLKIDCRYLFNEDDFGDYIIIPDNETKLLYSFKEKDYNFDNIYYNLNQSIPLGSPIIRLNKKFNFKIIGINDENPDNKKQKVGIHLKYPIYEYLMTKFNFDAKYNDYFERVNKNEINILCYLKKKNNFKKILNGSELEFTKEVEEPKIFVYINEEKYGEYYKGQSPVLSESEEGLYKINIKFNDHLRVCGKMFFDCANIIGLDLSSFHTKNIINMDGLFQGCKNIISLDLSSFDTRNVKSMNSMFRFCKNMISLNLSSFNTINVTSMHSLFSNCTKLSNINFSFYYFNTKNVKTMSSMFYFCKNLISLDLSFFNTENVTEMERMFSGCSNLKHLDLSSFDTKRVTNMKDMFSYCKSLKTLDLTSFNFEGLVQESPLCFEGDTNLKIFIDENCSENVNKITQTRDTWGYEVYKIKTEKKFSKFPKLNKYFKY